MKVTKVIKVFNHKIFFDSFGFKIKAKSKTESDKILDYLKNEGIIDENGLVENIN